jgi:hypothetical protein
VPEVIEVQQEDVHWIRAAQGRGEALVEERAVGQRRQRVAEGTGLEFVVVLGKRRGSGGALNSAWAGSSH